MTKTLFTIVSLFCCLLLSRTEAADVEFDGFVMFGDQWLVVLKHKDTQIASSWLARGQSFRGYTILSLDAKAETVSVCDGVKAYTLKLIASKVRPQVPKAKITEINIAITAAGALSIEGYPLRWETLEEIFAELAAGTEGVKIILNSEAIEKEQSEQVVRPIFREILDRMRKAGYKRGEVSFKTPEWTRGFRFEPHEPNDAVLLNQVVEAFRRANPGIEPNDAAALLPYASTREQRIAIESLKRAPKDRSK